MKRCKGKFLLLNTEWSMVNVFTIIGDVLLTIDYSQKHIFQQKEFRVPIIK